MRETEARECAEGFSWKNCIFCWIRSRDRGRGGWGGGTDLEWMGDGELIHWGVPCIYQASVVRLCVMMRWEGDAEEWGGGYQGVGSCVPSYSFFPTSCKYSIISIFTIHRSEYIFLNLLFYTLESRDRFILTRHLEKDCFWNWALILGLNILVAKPKRTIFM